MPRGTAAEDKAEHDGGRPPPTATNATGPGSVPASCAVVVGFDRSGASLAAVQQAARLGDRLGASITVVHVVDLADFPVDPDSADWEQAAGRALAAERATVAEILAGYRWGWVYRLTSGEPAAALAAAASELDAEMIVVGTRGEGWKRILDRLLTPSVSHRVITAAPCPVLVVGDAAGR